MRRTVTNPSWSAIIGPVRYSVCLCRRARVPRTGDARTAFFCFFDKGKKKAVDFISLTMVCMKSDINIIFVRYRVDIVRQRDRTEKRVFDCLPRSVSRTAERHLDDPVRSSLRKPRQHTVDGFHRENIDSRERVFVFVGGIKHFAICFIVCNRHFYNS